MGERAQQMADGSVHVAPLLGAAAGASVSFLLFNGNWWERLVAGACGGMFSFIATPIFSPLVAAGLGGLYHELGLDVAAIQADAVPGFTGFVLGLVGIDMCRWGIERTRYALSVLRIPGWRREL
jgi:hypothetical protein